MRRTRRGWWLPGAPVTGDAPSNTPSPQAGRVRASLVLALVSAAAVPVAVESTIGPLDPASFGQDSDLMEKAQEIAKRDFAASASLEILDVQIADQRTGAFGERIRPDVGYAFHLVDVRFTNTGKVDVAVSSWHFSGLDEIGSDHSVELGNAHEDFDASRLSPGHSRNGRLYFEIEKGSWLTQLVWEGDLGSANTTMSAYEHP